MEDIVKIIAYADKLKGLQAAIDLTDRKQANVTRRTRRDRKQKSR